MKPPIPTTDERRLRWLEELKLINSSTEPAFDDITLIASEVFGAPIVSVAFVGEDRLHFKSVRGVELWEAPREGSFSDLVIDHPERTLIIPDATLDDRFAGKKGVASAPHIRFFAGAPLVMSDGTPLGVLCVIDRVPRQVCEHQVAVLESLARQVVRLLEERKRSIELEDALVSLRASEELLRSAGRMARVGSWLVDFEAGAVVWSEQTKMIHEVSPDYEPTLAGAIEFYPVEVRSTVVAAVERARQEGVPYDIVLPFVTATGRQIIVRAIAHPEFRDGRCVRLAGVFQDVSSQSVEERRAREIDQCLAKVSAQVPGFLYQFKLRPDGSSCFPYASIGIQKIYSTTPEEVREDASKAWKAIHPDDRSRVQNSAMESARSMQMFHCEYRVLSTEGDVAWVEANSQPELLTDGSVLWHGFVTDITARVRDQNEIRLNELRAREIDQRLAKVSAQVPGFLYQFKLRPDGTSCFPYASEGIRDIYRVTPEQVRDDASEVFRRLHPEDAGRIVDSIQLSARTLDTWTCEYRVMFDDGTIEWLDGRATPEKLPDGTILWHGFITNVTARVNAQTSIRESEARLSVALESSNIGLWDWCRSDGKTFFTDCWYTMLGYAPGELPMHVDSWRAILHPDDEQEVFEKLTRHLQGIDPVYRAEQRLRQKDGTYRWVLDVGRVISRDENGDSVRMIGVHIDIDAMKRVQSELERARAESDVANQTKSEFLANMSHEIRTPMTAILGYLDLLRDVCESPEAVSSIDVIQRNGDHLLTVLNDILDLSKIEAGKMSIESVSVDPRQLLEQVLSMARLRLRNDRLSLTLDIDAEVPQQIVIDPTRLRQILFNLVSNAIKFTERGAVTVHLRRVSGPAGNSEIQFTVSDTGIGMSPEQVANLFKPFQQADLSTTRRFGGTGLGLAISHRLVSMLGGSITVSSELGRGTTFCVTFAVPDTGTIKLPAPAERSQLPRVSRQAKRVLVVEDAVAIRKLVELLLQRVGAETEVAENGEVAMSVWHAAREEGRDFDLVLLDMQMPVMDGYTTAATLRREGFGGQIVALTAHAMSDDSQKCIAAGCDGYMTKPIDRAKLESLVVPQSRRAA